MKLSVSTCHNVTDCPVLMDAATACIGLEMVRQLYWDHVPVLFDDNPELIGDKADFRQYTAQSSRTPRSLWTPQ